ncbi:MAG: excinuclease ABC subunit UvrA [Haliscomenobacter sp.]|uniref:excinuclease ABC subunit UvrA n=1 Tax=Haliscomenobacter sp. TaxID=2717303 RepID=UPI0029BA6BC7|nr:excinuclease ABC subunit UvrA [Haliscomenobacter sp.]MDX2070255.1 excinuclease ABC subunit UvrA [Haliscomenobacter sp.]
MSSQPNGTDSLDFIEVIGAREHNLKDINVRIPRNKLVVITGLSGSGKSSLAFDTIYAEGQRRYMETFSAYARQFIGEMERPDVERIDGLSPVISIEQKTTGRNPRSTVGTITEIYDFMRLLYARVGEAYSYATGKKMERFSEEQMRERLLLDLKGKKISLLAPMVRGRKGHYRELFEQVRKQGFTKIRVDNEVLDVVPDMQVDRYKVHDIEVVVDRLTVNPDNPGRLFESLASALKIGNGVVMILNMDNQQITTYSKHLFDFDSGISYEEPSPNTFSFNSPYGACPTCNGLGFINQVDMAKVIPDPNKSITDGGFAPLGELRENMAFKQLKVIAKEYKFSLTTPIKDIPAEAMEIILRGGGQKLAIKYDGAEDAIYNMAQEGLVKMLERWYEETTSEKIRIWAEEFMTITECPECHGFRLRQESLHYRVHDRHIGELSNMDIAELVEWMDNLHIFLNDRQQLIAKDVLKEIRLRLGFLMHVGLEYLTLHRPSRTLSGGESQRIRLATQIGSQLTGITYILDEPSIGLHQRDNQKLIEALRQLSNIGNTVLVVEHDKDIMMASDYLIDLGPGAGKHGGELVAEGIPHTFLEKHTITSEYLSARRNIEVPKVRRKGNGQVLELIGAKGNNLKNVSISIPLATFCCVTGVSGSGKSTLINETLYPILRQHFYNSLKPPMPYTEIRGLEHLDKVIEIDQSPIGRTPRSNPATYTGVFTDIRNIFAELPEAKIRGYKPGRFSFNVKGGRCEVCEGSGMRVIEMNFLPDVYVHCENCLGRRYNRETLEVLYKGKSINDVLDMPVSEGVEFFQNIPKIYRKLKTLEEVGLGYITLGQQATTLSGGEAQRVKLAEELSKRDTGRTIYILDEPTTGLHFEDIRHLLEVLNKLVERGNTVLVIEHNMDVIKVADYIIDMGLEGGQRGGEVICTGTPEQIAKHKQSHTARFLKLELK